MILKSVKPAILMASFIKRQGGKFKRILKVYFRVYLVGLDGGLVEFEP